MPKKKIKEIFIGSNNKGKLKEIADLLPNHLKIYSNLDYKIPSPLETGTTFKQNSLLKAKYFSKKTDKICMSDDSGIEIDILDKKPGVHSADWAGKKRNFNLAINKVYKEIFKKDKNWKKKIITARFICVLTIFWPNGRFISKIGKVEGRISKLKKGKNGFGYDPIFIPKGRRLTFGELNPQKKYKIDHRYNAFKKIKKFF
ncbi:non-canonical purine NTP pyrophosphatase [Candidatus Pelagibacter sp.]|nr:non-canonical purine NTP pyrophosphatase [Candidatus Pelagibacter sp.]